MNSRLATTGSGNGPRPGEAAQGPLGYPLLRRDAANGSPSRAQVESY